jgi:hypothetical protein
MELFDKAVTEPHRMKNAETMRLFQNFSFERAPA